MRRAFVSLLAMKGDREPFATSSVASFGPLSPCKKDTDILAWVQWRATKPYGIEAGKWWSTCVKWHVRKGWEKWERRWFRRNPMAVHNCLMGWCREDGVRLFSEAQEALDTWKISTWYKEKLFQCKGDWAGLRDLHPWKYSKSRASWSSCPCFEQQAGHGDHQVILSTWAVVW